MTVRDRLVASEPIPFLDLRGEHGRLRSDLDDAWATVLDRGRFVGGTEVDAFEQEFAAFLGAGDCVGVGNGTDALELILEALGIGTGDEVVVPANTFVATVEAVHSVGAVPRFVDVRPEDLLIDPRAVEAAIGPRTAAVIAVHLFGQVADLPALGSITRRHGLALVEDAAQAHGARHGSRRVGTVGHAAAFSFYPGKNLGALGDGGAITSGDPALVEQVRSRADHGRDPHDRHVHRVPGRNSRLDSLQAAVLRLRLRRLDADNAARRDVLARYRDRLPPTCWSPVVDPDTEPVGHLAVVQVEERDVVTAALTSAGIGWGVHYPVPCHLQPAFADAGGRTATLPTAETAAGRVLSLPCSPGTTPEQIDRVVAVLAGATLPTSDQTSALPIPRARRSRGA